jgi:hypothetical protein
MRGAERNLERLTLPSDAGQPHPLHNCPLCPQYFAEPNRTDSLRSKLAGQIVGLDGTAGRRRRTQYSKSVSPG